MTDLKRDPLITDVQFRDLIPRGYTFQKLYASNYRCYWKDFGRYRIWAWQAGRHVEINDWYGQTKLACDFYKANIEEWRVTCKAKSWLSGREYVLIGFCIAKDRQEIKLRDLREWATWTSNLDYDAIEKHNDEWWTIETVDVPAMDLVMKELKFLCPHYR